MSRGPSHFSWQAKYLVKLECHFLWQGQHFVKFWKIAGARNVVCFHTKCVSKMGRLGLSSDCPRIVCILAEAIHGFSAEILNSELRGRRSTW